MFMQPEPAHREGRQHWAVDLHHIRSLIVEAELTDADAHRYIAAHQAAVRAADLVLTARMGRPLAAGVVDPWPMVRRCAPELGEWADFFSAAAVRHRLLVMQRTRVSTREADDLVRDAERFCHEVERVLRRGRP